MRNWFTTAFSAPHLAQSANQTLHSRQNLRKNSILSNDGGSSSRLRRLLKSRGSLERHWSSLAIPWPRPEPHNTTRLCERVRKWHITFFLMPSSGPRRAPSCVPCALISPLNKLTESSLLTKRARKDPPSERTNVITQSIAGNVFLRARRRTASKSPTPVSQLSKSSPLLPVVSINRGSSSALLREVASPGSHVVAEITPSALSQGKNCWQ